jgi:hypothetical protein
MTIDFTDLRDELRQLETRVTAELEAAAAQQKIAHRPDSADTAIAGTQANDRPRPSRTVIETLRSTSLLMLLTAPLTLALIIPIVLLDISVSLYQLGCFQVWALEPARRRDYVVFDRHHLPYLNTFEKFGCIYCSYFNGVISFTRDVASRTEAYWCPIKHVNRPAPPHERYDDFLAYGDASAWQARVDELKRKIG